jgi:hypothetical protein
VSILLFKLLITPMLIWLVSMAGRRWGSVVSGLLIGLPLTSGPISLVFAFEHGAGFSASAAVGTLAGEMSVCLFCLVFASVAQRANWVVSMFSGIVVILLSTWLWSLVNWQLLSVTLSVVALTLAVVSLIPYRSYAGTPVVPPRWDLPARMVLTTGFMLLLTAVASSLGPKLSGLIAPFPIFTIVFASFTHARQGPQAASNLLRGIVLSAAGFIVFFLVVGAALPQFGIATTYITATLLAVLASGLYYFVSSISRLKAIDAALRERYS